jgi:hypothetical protein
MAVFLPERLLKNYRLTGRVLFAARRRMNLLKNKGSNFKSKRFGVGKLNNV